MPLVARGPADHHASAETRESLASYGRCPAITTSTPVHRAPSPDPEAPGDDVKLRAPRPGITVDCRAVAGRIGAGLREHRSQHHVLSDVPGNPEQWDKRIKDEWHVVAWPAQESGAPMLADLFDHLS